MLFGKFKKYYNYLERFIKSPRKRQNIDILLAEIKGKGLITGVRSVLHIRSGAYTPASTKAAFYGFVKLAKTYDRTARIILPEVTQPLVSVIIPFYNQLDYTYDCVRSIVENNPDQNYEVILADDKSPDDTSNLLALLVNARCIRNETNLGFLKNCNNAAKTARGKYIVFLNNDTQVMKGWLAELLHIFQLYPQTGLVGSKLIYPTGQLQEAGGVIWQDGSAINYGCRSNPDNPEFNYVKEVDYISGASVMIDKQAWDALGGFDEAYSPAYNEDSDFCFALREIGYKVIYTPFSEVVHFEGISHGTDTGKGVKQYQVTNQQKFADKWRTRLQEKSKRGTHLFSERDRTTGKKHVLIIDHNVPTVDKDAGSRTINNFVDTLLSLDCSVKFLVPNLFPDKAYCKLLQLKGVEVLYGEDYLYYLHQWEQYFEENMNSFDAVLLSRASICIPFIKFLNKHKYKGTTIYYGHDLGFLRTEQEGKLKNDPSLLKVAKKLKADEDFMYTSCDNALMISDVEINYLKSYINTPLHYIPPYFFEPNKYVPGFEQREGILFVGGFQHPPNLEAMTWFLDEMYPALERQNISLTIAGSEMPERILNYRNRFRLLQILPAVSTERLEALYAKTRVAIVPLRVGAGVKGKVVEAMAKGVPIAGTDRAFEGLRSVVDFPYTGRNTCDELTHEILSIYNNKQIWQVMSDFGIAYVQAHFNKENMKLVFKMILDGENGK